MKHSMRKPITDVIGVMIGVAITAFGLAWFLIPNQIAAGGVAGLATIIYYVFDLPVGVSMLALNTPLFIATLKIIGVGFGAKTILGAVSLSILVDVFSWYAEPITEDPLLAAVYGGVLAGIGLGLAFRCGGSTGGTDMAAQILSRYIATSVGQALLLVDGVIIVLAGIVFGPEMALYALVAVFVTMKAVDVVQEGQSYAKAVFIISRHPEEMGKAILFGLDRGATGLRARGIYTNAEREVIFVIVARSEIAKLKEIVHENDAKAFFVIADVNEVLGEGFKRLST